MDGTVFDAVVIGGGMAGAGVARDLALRGASVALFEKGDFASGTSSRSSKLVHGGLRYLELMDWGLVRESLREKKTLERLAPHLVRMDLAQDYVPPPRMAARLRRRFTGLVPALSPGSLGRPTLATAEKGKRLYELIRDRIATSVLGSGAA